MEFLRDFFSSQSFMPHGHCYLWNPGLVVLEVASNGLIGVSYLVISTTLAVLVYRLRDIPFKLVYLAFGLFIVTCGFTHFLDIWVIWVPTYWVDAFVRAITAAASVGTAIVLPALVPRVMGLVRAARVAEQRGIQVENALRDLGTSLERAKQLDQLKTTLFANVSHELRTPLQLILGPASAIALAPNLTDAQRLDVATIVRNAHLLLKQVNDFLDVAKLESGGTDIEYVATDVARLFRAVAQNFDAHARSRKMHWYVEAPTSLLGDVDIRKVEKALLNLLSNAFKFTPEGGTIRISLRQELNKLVFDVEDSGPGVAAEQRATIFERFRQGDASLARQFGGTGLGLAIVKEFVELHHGSVSVSGSPLGGARFTVHLPVHAPNTALVLSDTGSVDAALSVAARTTVEELRVLPERARAMSIGKGPRVLVVEDNPEMRDFIVRSLPPDYQVATAGDGAEGLAAAESLQPDLIVTDVMMPRLSGDALLAAVRTDPRLEATPVLLLSARAEEEFRTKLLGQGAQDYLTKPFAAEEFRARASNLVAMKRVRDRLQKALTSSTSDVEVLAAQLSENQARLQTALEIAERANQFKGEFLGLVAHELRTPVSALQLQLHRLRVEMTKQEDPTKTLERMGVSMSRVTTLIDSLLEYARSDSGHLSVSLGVFSVAEVVRDAIDELRPSAERKGIELRFVENESLPQLRSDARLVRLILSNLMANAVKFTDHGAVEVMLGRGSNGEQVLAVRDTGPGIRVEDRDGVFEPFSQPDSTRALQQSGVGLGLALVRAMVSALGGRVWLESEVGQGSTFSVAIPMAAWEA